MPAATFERLYPSVHVPKLVTPQTASVNYMAYVGENTRYGRMGVTQLYLTAITNLATITTIGQQWADDLIRQDFTMGQIGAPYYFIEALVDYDVKESAHFSEMQVGISLPAFLETLARQAINQRRHYSILYGFDTGQGILANTTIETLPADSKGNTTMTTYEIPEFISFLSSVVSRVMTDTLNTSKKLVIASSPRIINYLKGALIPMTTIMQSGSTLNFYEAMIKIVAGYMGVDSLEFIPDTLLEGATSDKFLLVVPGLGSQDNVPADIDENLVGALNQANFNTFFDSSASGLMKFTSPERLGKYEEKYNYQMTPGVNLRKECIVELDIPFS